MQNIKEILCLLDGTIRFQKGQQLFEEKAVRKVRQTKEGLTLFKVKSQSKPDLEYEVLSKGRNSYECNCPDYSILCKHIYSVILTEVLVK